jgi:2-amino-4-hydroxy-6-hydroxymethyldihydropteridine diphosphokinase
LNLAAVGFGANLGRVERTFATALDAIAAHEAARVEAVSSLWKSAAWGRTDQPDFLNGVALVSTGLDPEALLAFLRVLEDRAGRTRDERWGPRTLDLDLLFFGEVVREDAALSLPHPRLAERSFVLEPLVEIAPHWRHPVLGKSASALRADLQAGGAWTPCARVDGSRLGTVREEPACLST